MMDSPAIEFPAKDRNKLNAIAKPGGKHVETAIADAKEPAAAWGRRL